jgi:hypothetical protein
MTGKKFTYITLFATLALFLFSLFKILNCHRSIFSELDIIVTAILTGIISGFLGNRLFIQFQKEYRIKAISKKLRLYEGQYEVYHWRDLLNPDACKYIVTIKLDTKNGILHLHQVGTENVHELIGEVKINEDTFTYGEGNYFHPQRAGRPTGRIQLFLMKNGIINIDKYYLNDTDQIPGFEKWQWRKK